MKVFQVGVCVRMHVPSHCPTLKAILCASFQASAAGSPVPNSRLLK